MWGKWGIALIWVISLRGLTRRVRLIIKPMLILLIIVLALWWLRGWFTGKEAEVEEPLLIDDYLPLGREVRTGPWPRAAAFSFPKWGGTGPQVRETMGR